jgi:hypothetical protein
MRLLDAALRGFDVRMDAVQNLGNSSLVSADDLTSRREALINPFPASDCSVRCKTHSAARICTAAVSKVEYAQGVLCRPWQALAVEQAERLRPGIYFRSSSNSVSPMHRFDLAQVLPSARPSVFCVDSTGQEPQ